MKSKNILFALSLLECGAGFTSCDDIAEDDRFIKIERPPVNRVVLIQEFTGVWCSNCPDGARTIHSLQESFPGAFIAVGLQPEGINLTRPINGLSLATADARTYYDAYGVVGLPSACINGAAPIADSRLWSTPAITALSGESPAIITLSTSYDASSRNLDVNYSVEFNKLYSEDLSILVWVIENGIVGGQIDNGRMLRDYVHNHVFRASANGTWGESIGNYFIPEEKVDGTASIKLADGWKAENCQVVAFIFNTGSKAVEQAVEADVIEE